jgi:plasmid stabilization system protein ParE
MRAEEKLFAAFDTIARRPGTGHLRHDLLRGSICFYYVKPYLVLYRRDTMQVTIGAVLDGARNLAVLLRERPI